MTARSLFLAAAACLLLAAPAAAQTGRTHPGQGYFAAIDELQAGLFRRAERGMRNELRTAVKTIDSRWVDSIIYSAGLGEALYQQGRLAEALAAFDAAVDQFLQEPDWMRGVQWRQRPQQGVNLARRRPAWARVGRPATYADVPRTFLYQVGQVNNSAALQGGGPRVVVTARFRRIDAEELAHAIAWTLYRRGDLLGPLGAYDARTKAVADRLSGGGLGPANHWTEAWTELWWGLAEASRGSLVEARPHLERSLLLGGSLDHRLAGIGWLARGWVALGGGDKTAFQTFQEAAHIAAVYQDIRVLEEALRGWRAAVTADPAAPVPGPPLAGVIEWADRRSFWFASARARLLAAEPAAWEGDPSGVQGVFRRARDGANGLIGRQADWLVAVAAAASSREEGLAAAGKAIAAQREMSRRLLQVGVANRWFDEGSLSPRLARQAYAEVLAEPIGYDWNTAPLETLSWTGAPSTGAFERWFATAIDGDDAALALRIVDAQRRRELLSARPLSGRLATVRWLLNAPDETLPASAFDARAQAELRLPKYRLLDRETMAAAEQLRGVLAETSDSLTPALKKASGRLAAAVADQEQAALRIALSRGETPAVFPPPLEPVAGKARLKEGEAVVVFHQAGGELFGLLQAPQGEHLWKIGKASRVAAQVERLLKAVVGSSPRQKWTLEELEDPAWEAAAEQLGQTLLGGSRLDGARLNRLVVVPDGALWRAPFDLLPIPDDRDTPTRIGDVSLAYAPTPGWALRARPGVAPVGRGAPDLVRWRLSADPKIDPEWEGGDPLETTAGVTTPPRGYEPGVAVLKSSCDALVIDAAGQRLAVDPLGLNATPAGRGERRVALGVWNTLPWRGPETIALVGLGGGEAGGVARRAKTAPAVGAPEMHLIGALLAGGAERVLVERWPSRGVLSRELVAEWLIGLSRLDPAEAWRRSAELGRSKTLDPAFEPRLDTPETDAPTADHPFWWSGHFVVD